MTTSRKEGGEKQEANQRRTCIFLSVYIFCYRCFGTLVTGKGHRQCLVFQHEASNTICIYFIHSIIILFVGGAR